MGLTQAELAEKAGISRSLYSLIELGISRPSIQVALRLAYALDMSVEEVFGHLADEDVSPQESSHA